MNFEPWLEGHSPVQRGVSNALLPLSLVWRSARWIHTRMREGERMPGPIPTICIGSPTVGGAGKTPLTDYTSRLLDQIEGVRPGIVVGHARDEADLHRLRNPGFPVELDQDRRAAVVRLAENGATVAVLDDAMEYASLAASRVVLIPVEQWGLRHRFLPSGPWRRPYNQAQPDDFVVLTRRAETTPGFELVKSELAHEAVAGITLRPSGLFSLRSGQSVEKETLTGRRVLVVAGIARPSALVNWVRGLGPAEVSEWHPGDHARYSPRNLEKLLHKARLVDYVVTTEKDAVKLRNCLHEAGPETFFADVKITWDFGQRIFDEFVLSAVPGGKAAVANR